MTTGMKRFTKVCLYTALVTFIIGAVMCGVGWMFGGFGQLNDMDVRGITEIPFVYRFFPNGGRAYRSFLDDDAVWRNNYGNWDHISDRLGDIDDIDGPAPALSLTADTIRDLYIEMGGTLYIEESPDEYVRLAMDGDANKFRYHIDDGVLSIVRKSDWTYWNRKHWNTDDKVYLYLPKGTAFGMIDIELGAGRIESIDLTAVEAYIEVGAGEGIFSSLTVEDVAELSVGAGWIKLESLSCDAADIGVGAGEMSIGDAVIGTCIDIDSGMGDVVVDGLTTEYMDIDCYMGTVTLNMLDSEKDHNYEIDCTMGTVNVGGRSYSGLADEVTIYNGSSNYFDIDCSMGTVNITFAE